MNKFSRWGLVHFFVIIIAVVFFGVLLIQTEVQADEIPATVTVGNIVPVASSADINNAATSIQLTENTTTTVTIKATVSDNNGCEDIDSVTVTFFRTDVGAGASDDDNNHYSATASSDGNCTGGGGDLTDTYTATVSVNYYADPTDDGSPNAATDWTAKVIPYDEATGTADTDTIEMSSLAALNTTGSVAYGVLGLGANTGTTDQTVVVTNTGNEGIDTDLDGYGSANGDGNAMGCTIGSIPVANEKYSATASTGYASKVALSDSAAKLDLDVAQRTGEASTKDVYWGLGMPSTGISGSCSGVVVFTANPDPFLD